MTPLEFALSLFGICVFAGFFGSLVGLGGGIIVVPVLTLIYGIDIRYAIGNAIVSVIATSSGAVAANVREKMTSLRTAMLLSGASYNAGCSVPKQTGGTCQRSNGWPGSGRGGARAAETHCHANPACRGLRGWIRPGARLRLYGDLCSGFGRAFDLLHTRESVQWVTENLSAKDVGWAE